jgi:hypothetical protein
MPVTAVGLGEGDGCWAKAVTEAHVKISSEIGVFIDLFLF